MGAPGEALIDPAGNRELACGTLKPNIFVKTPRSPVAVAILLLPMPALWKWLAVAQLVFAVTIARAQATVEMQYCGVRLGKPPLKYLAFNVTVRNLAAKPQWFLFPRALYEQAPSPPKQSGVDGAEIFSSKPDRNVTVAQFMGSIRLQPESAGGFQALRLPAGAVVSIRDFSISFWGENFSPLPVQIVIADQLRIGSIPADGWAGVPLVSAQSADVSSKQLVMIRSKFTRRRSQLSVTMKRSGEITVANALARTCPESH